MLATLLGKIHLAWNPATQDHMVGEPERGEEEEANPLDRKIDRGNKMPTLADTITIFGKTETEGDL